MTVKESFARIKAGSCRQVYSMECMKSFYTYERESSFPWLCYEI